ncbi:MAG: DUF4194 domain-containing protein [Leptospiraceae bacterium]|nr:DUF4194 domain-containing protein [Leptospiraceae bacterium]MCP5497360.1 DUF4194 domain-containing protein [Leptospiraceae bacterium]
MTQEASQLPFADAIIKLLQGVVYDDNQAIWNKIIENHSAIINYFRAIGVDVFLAESEGYCYLKQKDSEDEQPLPRLVEKRPLSYPLTLLLVLLRERLLDFDIKGETTRLIIGREEIKSLLSTFLPDENNEAKLLDKIDTYINKLQEYGFLRKMQGEEDNFEVKRILKAKISADELIEIKEKLIAYARTVS